MKRRAKLSHGLLNVDFFNYPKVKALLPKFGATAQLFCARLMLMLSNATDAEMSIDAALGDAYEIRLENPEAVLEYCISSGLFFSPRPGVISQTHVVEDQEKLAASQDRWRESKKKSRGQDVESGAKREPSELSEESEGISSSEGGSGGKPEPNLDHPHAVAEMTGLPKRGTDRLPLHEDQYRALLMNHWHSDENALEEALAFATDACATKGLYPQDPVAYMRNWKRREANFAPPKPGESLGGKILRVSQNVVNAHHTQKVVEAYKVKAKQELIGDGKTRDR